MNELSLFTGAGGGVLGTKLLGWRTIGYVEWEKYCQQVLAQRIQDGFLDEAPIFGDIDHFIKSGASKKYAGFVDVVTAGFPCQPFSVAGKQRGEEDERNKWPQTLQCIRDVRPRYALLENVPGLLNSGYFGEILSSLAEAGFDARWCVLGADDVGAPHRRKRLWILAYSISAGTWGNGGTSGNEGWRSSKTGSKTLRQGDRSIGASRSDSASEDVQDPERSGCLHGEHEEGRVQVREQRESGSRGGERVSGDSPDVADSISVGHGRRSAVGSGGTDAIGHIHPSEEEQTGQHVWSEAVGRSSVRGKEDVADSDNTGDRASRHGIDRDRETETQAGKNITQHESRRLGEDVADSDSPRLKQGNEAMAGGSPEQPNGGSIQPGEDVSYPNDPRLQGRLQDREFDSEGRQVEGDGPPTERGTGWERSGNEHWWSTEPNVGRVAHGVASRVDRLKALGNGQVPAVAATAWLLLTDQK